jgi:hypothetical protein
MLALLGYSALLLLELGALGVIAYVVSHADERRRGPAPGRAVPEASPTRHSVSLTPQAPAGSQVAPPAG